MVVLKKELGPFVVGTNNLLHLKSEPMSWAHLLDADTNLWKLKLTLIIIGWVWSKMGEALKILELLN